MGPSDRTVEETIARLASRAWGVVTHAELRSAGVSVKQIKGRVRKGLLIREHPGVYRAGHRAPSAEATYMAAVKAGGQGARLTGEAAAYLVGIVKRRRPPRPEVSAPRQRTLEGVKTRHVRKGVPSGERWTYRGIPTLKPAAILVELAATLPADELARACHEAGVKYGTTPRQVEVVLARRHTAKGAAKLRAISRGDEPILLSRMEAEFRRLLRAEGLALPATNRPAGSNYADCRWPGIGLTVELDSYRFHNSRHTWEQDRKREREARARGDEFRRYSWSDIFESPRPMLDEVRALLEAGRPRGAQAQASRPRPAIRARRRPASRSAAPSQASHVASQPVNGRDVPPPDVPSPSSESPSSSGASSSPPTFSPRGPGSRAR